MTTEQEQAATRFGKRQHRGVTFWTLSFWGRTIPFTKAFKSSVAKATFDTFPLRPITRQSTFSFDERSFEKTSSKIRRRRRLSFKIANFYPQTARIPFHRAGLSLFVSRGKDKTVVDW